MAPDKKYTVSLRYKSRSLILCDGNDAKLKKELLAITN